MPKSAKKASPHRVAVVQHPSVALHRERTLKRGAQLLEEAASHRANLVAFPETRVPTSPGRMVWGRGDASGLKGVETPSGRLGSLICWENYMPLARFSLFAQGCEIYIAPTWDFGEGWISTMRHIAQEGRCWVLGIGSALRDKDVPADFPERARGFPNRDQWVNARDSVIVSPNGAVVAGRHTHAAPAPLSRPA